MALTIREIQKQQEEVTVIYHHFSPEKNRGGSGSFYCVTVWETNLHIPNISGWTVPVRILEARLVVRNVIKFHIHEVSGVEDRSYILDYAIRLADTWGPLLESADKVGTFL